jgi:hypothetical protein
MLFIILCEHLALAAYGLGGYIAGRMRAPFDVGEATEFQDGCMACSCGGSPRFLPVLSPPRLCNW